MKMSRRAYAEMFGPTVGDRVRLADTELFIEVEQDLTTYGEEVKFGGGKVIRDGMGQSQLLANDVADTVITNALIVDWWGIVKADVGLKNGRIWKIGKAGNPDIQPDITIPANTIEVVVNDSGEIFAKVQGNAGIEIGPAIGRLALANFTNEAGLEPLGGNLYRETEASGGPIAGSPGDPGFGTVKQGYLEASNVDPVKEITDLISAQRAYEMNSKVIQAADEMAATVSKNMR